MDIDLTDFKKGEANVTGFQIVNYADPGVSRIVQQWMDFDNKDSKVPKKGLKVNTLCAPAMPYKFMFLLTRMKNTHIHVYELYKFMFWFSFCVSSTLERSRMMVLK